jgi:pyruvate/2-oxoglutarate dehydrogenase complex dihydrolipoamide acyltransferase (E2) component
MKRRQKRSLQKSRRLKISGSRICFTLGPIAKKSWVVADRIEIRDILHLTVLVDHDVVDGIPAARFAARLATVIQEGVEESLT